MASTRPSPNLSTVVSGLHLIFTLASVAFLSYKVYYLECELSLIRGKESLSDGRIVTEATPPSLILNGKEHRSERNRRADQEKVKSSSASKFKEMCVQKLLNDLQVRESNLLPIVCLIVSHLDFHAFLHYKLTCKRTFEKISIPLYRRLGFLSSIDPSEIFG